ncbi:MAG TPA: tRNA pseudouridine(55) synthase TruB [Casimicrobiaceae bacterium]|nr:tRNA pseudouridine(55) synthase TruB [Casimicrobiaceae bacterium]
MIAREHVDGVLLLDKPSGLSSNAALQRARRLFNAAKAGHTGTLDPLASGLLPLCFGDATKFAQALLDARKEYVATVQFGTATDTGDAEGEVVAHAPVAFATADLDAVLQRFVGTTQQLPPRYAALKYQGRNYYEYARAGLDVPRLPRTIHIDTLELMEHAGDRAILRVACSKGTYVRALVEDIARALGSAGHLAGLRRNASGPFRIDQARRLEEIESLDASTRRSLLLPVDVPIADLPSIALSEEQSRALIEGRPVRVSSARAGRIRAYDSDGAFLGLAELEADLLRAVRLVDTSRRRQRSPLAVES